MSLDSIDEALAGGGAKSAFTRETPIGTEVTGTIIDASVQQIKDYVTSKPKFWDDGRPQEQIAIRLKTNLRDPSNQDDEGVRGVYIKTWGVWKEALLEAVKGAGFTKVSQALTPGNQFTAKFSGTQPSAQGSDTKLYQYTVQPAQASALDDLGADKGTGEIPAQQPVAQAPVSAPPAAPHPPAPAAAPAPAPAAADPIATARQLMALGIDDNTIAANTGLDPVVIAALRNQAA